MQQQAGSAIAKPTPSSTTVREISAAGARFTVHCSDDGETRFWAKFEAGTWEPDTLDIIARHTGGNVHFFDIGTWIGPTALFAAAHGSTVTAVEADPFALASLRRNIALNPALAGSIEVVDRALSLTPGRIRFGSRRKGGDSMSSLVHDNMQTAWEVETIAPEQLASHCTSGKTAFLKIDIEGGEYIILDEADALFNLPLSGVHLSLHPQMLLGETAGLSRLSRWLQAARVTARVFRRLGHMRISQSDHEPSSGLRLVRWLAPLGLCLWPLKGSWLFEPR